VFVRVRCPRMGVGGLHDHGETTAHPGADDPQAPRGRKLLNEGNNIDEVCKHLEVSAPTWHRWVAQYGGMKGEDTKRAVRDASGCR